MPRTPLSFGVAQLPPRGRCAYHVPTANINASTDANELHLQSSPGCTGWYIERDFHFETRHDSVSS